jgi:hypothetical protein
MEEDKMDIWDMQVNPRKSDILRETVQAGQKVRIIRMVTISYEINVSDVLDGLDETDISVEALLTDEFDNVGVWDISDNYEEAEIGDDVAILVEII